MAEPLARFEGFEGFQGFEGFEAFEGQFRATRKKGFGAPELQRPVWQNHWQGSRGLRGFQGFEGFEAFEGQFRELAKKGFGAPEPRAHNLRNSAHSLPQSPEPTV